MFKSRLTEFIVSIFFFLNVNTEAIEMHSFHLFHFLILFLGSYLQVYFTRLIEKNKIDSILDMKWITFDIVGCIVGADCS